MLKQLNYKSMKVSRIYPYNKTKGERNHEYKVAVAKRIGFSHSGSKKAKILHNIMDQIW